MQSLGSPPSTVASCITTPPTKISIYLQLWFVSPLAMWLSSPSTLGPTVRTVQLRPSGTVFAPQLSSLTKTFKIKHFGWNASNSKSELRRAQHVSERCKPAIGLQATCHLLEPIAERKTFTASAGQSGSNAVFRRHAHIRATLSSFSDASSLRCKNTSLCNSCRRLNRTRNRGFSNHTECFMASLLCNACR